MASLTSWVDTRTLAVLIDPFNAAAIYEKLEAEPPEELSEDEILWLAAVETSGVEATWVIRSLMSAKIHPAETWEEDYVVHGKTIVLRQGPIDEVVKVETVDPCGSEPTAAVADWCWPGDNSVILGTSEGYTTSLTPCSTRGVVRVTYRTKDNLPPGALVNVTWLAGEYMKAATGQSCSLPERITSITRQGVSWTMLDPMDFLNGGLTGVGKIDSWLSTARREHPSASMYDPYKSDRIRSILLQPEPEPVA